MSQLSINISTDLLGQIFLELFQFKPGHFFGDTLYEPLTRALIFLLKQHIS